MLSNKSNSSTPTQEWAYVGKGVSTFWVWAAIALGAVYVAWFFIQPIEGAIRRLDRFILLLLPSELWHWTIGGGATHLEIGVLDRVLPFSLCVLWMLASWWIGRPSLQLISCRLSWLESMGISSLFGLSLLSTATLFIGLAGGLNRIALFLVVAVLCCVSFLLQRRLRSSPNTTLRIPDELLSHGQTATWLWRLLPLGVGVLVVMYIFTGLMPPFEFDVVEYHAQAPKEYYANGKIDFLGHNVYANMPLAIEMHSLAAMVMVGGQDGWWLGSITGNCIICLISLLAVGMASGYTARYFGRKIGWATAAILLSAPGNILVSGCGLIDAAMGAYLLATAVCLQIWRENRTPLNTEIRAIPASPVLACFFAGTAAACKYTGLVFACAPAVLYILTFIYPELFRRWPAIKLGLAAVLVCTVTVAPWIVRNLLWTANPVFPLASQVFGNGNLTDEQIARWNKAHEVPKSANGSAYDWPALKAALHSLAGKSEFLPAALVPLVMIGVCICLAKFWQHPASLPLMLGIWVLVVWWFATHRIDRFWLPSLPLFSIVAAAGMRWLLIRGQSATVALVLLVTLSYAGVVSLTGIFADSRWFVSYDSLRKDEATDKTPGRLPQGIGWINLRLPQESKILLLGEARAFLFEHPLLYATCFNTPPGELVLSGRNREEQLKWLRQNEVTHLFVQWCEIERYRRPGNYGFSQWPARRDIQAMIESGVVRPVAAWPVPRQVTELLEVNYSLPLNGD